VYQLLICSRPGTTSRKSDIPVDVEVASRGLQGFIRNIILMIHEWQQIQFSSQVYMTTCIIIKNVLGISSLNTFQYINASY